MARKDMIVAVADATGISRESVGIVVKAALEFIEKQLSQGEEVSFKGFGKFYLQERSERQGRNPKTKEPIKIASRRIPKFKAGRDLKKAVR